MTIKVGSILCKIAAHIRKIRIISGMLYAIESIEFFL